MPAYAHEVQLAREYGCRFVFQAAPLRIVGQARVEGIELQKMRLGAPDASGRRKPEPVPGEVVTLACDMVIAATGQEKHLELLEPLPERAGSIAAASSVDERTMQTSNPRYFAGGDCVSGGQEVVNAVAEGKRAAAGIASFIERSLGATRPSRRQSAA